MLSDGQHYLTAMLASPLNALVYSNNLTKFSVLRVADSFINQVQGRRCVPPALPARSLDCSTSAGQQKTFSLSISS